MKLFDSESLSSGTKVTILLNLNAVSAPLNTEENNRERTRADSSLLQDVCHIIVDGKVRVKARSCDSPFFYLCHCVSHCLPACLPCFIDSHLSRARIHEKLRLLDRHRMKSESELSQLPCERLATVGGT